MFFADGIRGSWQNDLLGWKQKRALQLYIAIGLAFLLCRIPTTVMTLWQVHYVKLYDIPAAFGRGF